MTLPTREQYLARLTASRIPCGFSAGSTVADECPVCYEEVTTPVKTTCNHSFCEECLRHWLSSAATCPSCRTEQYQRDPAELAQQNFDEMLRDAREEYGEGVSEGEFLDEWEARLRHRRQRHSLAMPGDMRPLPTDGSPSSDDDILSLVQSLGLARQEPPERPRRVLPASPLPPLPAWMEDTLPAPPIPPPPQRRGQATGPLGRALQAMHEGFGNLVYAPIAANDTRRQQQARQAPEQAPPRHNQPPQRAQQADRGHYAFNFGSPVPSAQRRNPLNMVPRHQGQGGRRNGRGR